MWVREEGKAELNGGLPSSGELTTGLGQNKLSRGNTSHGTAATPLSLQCSHIGSNEPEAEARSTNTWAHTRHIPCPLKIYYFTTLLNDCLDFLLWIFRIVTVFAFGWGISYCSPDGPMKLDTVFTSPKNFYEPLATQKARASSSAFIMQLHISSQCSKATPIFSQSQNKFFALHLGNF